jgi:hypothetical protein
MPKFLIAFDEVKSVYVEVEAETADAALKALQAAPYDVGEEQENGESDVDFDSFRVVED